MAAFYDGVSIISVNDESQAQENGDKVCASTALFSECYVGPPQSVVEGNAKTIDAHSKPAADVAQRDKSGPVPQVHE